METIGKGPSGETIDTAQHRALGSDSRATILRLVRTAAGGLTAAEMAAATGQHLSTTRAHLERLVKAGLLVKARASGGLPGRPAWRYRATSADPAPAPYRVLAAALLQHLPSGNGDVRQAAGQIGRDWGQLLARSVAPKDDPVDTVTEVLDGLGFSPRRRPAPPGAASLQVHLHTCPFLDLVGQNSDAMCGLHAGVVRGVLEHCGVRGDATVVEPFGAPAACVVHLPLPLRRSPAAS